MATLLILVFVVGYALIAFEHTIKIDKAASALLTGVLCWVVLLIGFNNMPAFQGVAGALDTHKVLHEALFEHLGEIAEILFFLLGAMTIVELIDVHDGFRTITDRINTTNKVKLLWIVSWIAFFLSACLDNLTTAIVMCALLRRIVRKQETRWILGGFIVIAANAGGAWSPIGDVTTIMLWIGGQLTTLHVIKEVLIPSLVSLLIPLLLATYFMRGQQLELEQAKLKESKTEPWEQKTLFILGTLALLSVPVFKTVTHYPPYMGVLLALGVLWYFTELLHRQKQEDLRQQLSVTSMLRKIDTPTILFFLGILLAVGSLSTSGHLRQLASTLDNSLGNIYLINGVIGVLSAIVDNVPLVAAAMGMYPLEQYATDSDFWNLLAYCAGTGGSILIIGSAAGVASMGILKINFMWYLRKISGYALIGYLAGIVTYWLLH